MRVWVRNDITLFKQYTFFPLYFSCQHVGIKYNPTSLKELSSLF